VSTAMLAIENIFGAAHDIWSVNVEEEYHLAGATGRDGATGTAGPILPPPHTVLTVRWRWGTTFLAVVSYFVLGFALWVHAWTAGVGTHTLCGCGDPALFLWFFQAPATSLAHLQNPFFSTAMFHPTGVNLLDQTSVMAITVPLIPVTWIFGPIAALNVASTVVPALTALTMFLVLRRWVRWGPGRYAGGLLYGFSPLVLTSVQYAHLMTAALMVLPLILAVLDELLLRQRHSPWKLGLVLGLLLFVQFFLSSEVLVIVVIAIVFSVVVLFMTAALVDRRRLQVLLPGAASGLGMGVLTAGALLAYPVLFALVGPAHLSGAIWPNIGAIGGTTGASFVDPTASRAVTAFTAYGGYEGGSLPSGSYLGWGLIVVLVVGTAIWFRDWTLKFFGLLLAFCVACSFGIRRDNWVPARVFAHIPLLENIIEQRFMAVGYLAAAVMLALLLAHARSGLRALPGLTGHLVGIAGGLGVGAVALVPFAVSFLPGLPFTMDAVVLPRWYTTVAPTLPPGRVLLSYPVPFSGIQVALAWQAVNRMSYSQAGGGGPEGTSSRAMTARPGFDVLNVLSFGYSTSEPRATPAAFAATRRALSIWKVNTVVIAPEPSGNPRQQGHDPGYAAAYMTVVLGRQPVIQSGAWVWDDVSRRRGSSGAAGAVTSAQLQACVATEETRTRRGVVTASMGIPRCVVAAEVAP
jgi:hypothetical protein